MGFTREPKQRTKPENLLPGLTMDRRSVLMVLMYGESTSRRETTEWRSKRGGEGAVPAPTPAPAPAPVPAKAPAKAPVIAPIPPLARLSGAVVTLLALWSIFQLIRTRDWVVLCGVVWWVAVWWVAVWLGLGIGVIWW